MSLSKEYTDQSQVSEEDGETKLEMDAYVAMHEMRMDYAVGRYDNDPLGPELLQRCKNLGLPKNDAGKEFWEVLDQRQIDEISVCLAMKILAPEAMASLYEKFPEVQWDTYTGDAFDSACKDFFLQNPDKIPAVCFAECNSWKHGGLPIGRYITELARNFIDDLGLY
jgi:hypothetical protein